MRHVWTDEESAYVVAQLDKGVHYEDVAAAVTAAYGFKCSGGAIAGLGFRRGRRRRALVSPDRPPDAPAKSLDDMINEERLAALRRHEAREEKENVREQARWKEFLETLKDAVVPLTFTQPKFAPPKVGKGDEEAAVLQVSDTHFGKLTQTYNIDVAQARFEKLVDKTLSIVALHRNAYPIKHLHIFFLGDIVEGEGIFPTQGAHLDAHAVKQALVPSQTVAGQLSRLACNFQTVTAHCVNGNHGRTSRFAAECANWDRVFYEVTKLATANVPNIAWDLPSLDYDEWHKFAQVFNTRFLLIHGDQIRMTLNLPFYGVTTRVSRWASSKKVSGFDAVASAHFHVCYKLWWGQKAVYANGTTVSDDDFALKGLGMESTERQWLYGVSPQHGVTWQYDLKVNLPGDER